MAEQLRIEACRARMILVDGEVVASANAKSGPHVTFQDRFTWSFPLIK